MDEALALAEDGYSLSLAYVFPFMGYDLPVMEFIMYTGYFFLVGGGEGRCSKWEVALVQCVPVKSTGLEEELILNIYFILFF